MSVLSQPLMDRGCSSACEAYNNGQFVQTPINTIHNNCNSPETVKGVGWWRQLESLRTPCENFLATPLAWDSCYLLMKS